jgi:hypothetical protein
MANQDGISASDIVDFAAREGNKKIEEQVNMKARLFSALDKQKMTGKRAIINIVAGGLSSTSQVEDFGALPTEAASTPDQGFVDAVAYVSRLGLGRIALATLSGVDDSADLLDTQIGLAASDMARQVGRAVYGSTLAIPTASTNTVRQAVAGEVVTMTVTLAGGLSDFREGEAYVFEAAAVTTGSFPVLCTNVAITSASVATVTFVGGPTGVPGYQTTTFADNLMVSCGGAAGEAAGVIGDIAVGDRFFLLGSRVKPTAGSAATGLVTRGAANASLVSLDTIFASGSLHGLASGVLGWTGISFAAALPTAQTFMQASQIMQARSGDPATHLVLNNVAAAAYASAQVSSGSFLTSLTTQPRRNVDGKLDQLGKGADSESGISMFGRPIIIDNNCPASQSFLINKDYLKVGEWQKMQAEDEGGSPLLLSRTTFSKEVQYSCIYNLICKKRNAHAQQLLTLA